jgi:hypothetical protein
MIKIQNEHLEKYVQEHIDGVQQYINYDVFSEAEAKYIKENIEHILGAKPYELKEIIRDGTILAIDTDILKKAFVGGSYTGGSVGYAKFITKDKTIKNERYDAYRLAEKLQVNVCPYCNINSTFTVIEEGNEKITRPEFDHFYDKATYPILALSFYNLIPSCHICNSTLKGREEFSIESHLNPYSDSFNEVAKFKLKIEKSTFYHSIKGFSLTLESEDIRANKNIESFKLETLYQNHKDIVLELIQKEAIYNESYLDELLTQYEGTLFKNREDLQRLIGGGYITDDEISKRPLSKLIKDISQELNLI